MPIESGSTEMTPMDERLYQEITNLRDRNTTLDTHIHHLEREGVEMAHEIARLRKTIVTWCDYQISTNDQIAAALTMVRDQINEQIIAEVNDPRNAPEDPAFRRGLRVARIIVNRVIGEPHVKGA